MQKTITTLLSKFGIEEDLTILTEFYWLNEMVVHGSLLRSIIAAEIEYNMPIREVLIHHDWSDIHTNRLYATHNEIPYAPGAEAYFEYTNDTIFCIEYREKARTNLRYSAERIAHSELLCPVMNLLAEHFGIDYSREDVDKFLLVPQRMDIFARLFLKKLDLEHMINYHDRRFLEFLSSGDPIAVASTLTVKPYEHMETDAVVKYVADIPLERKCGWLFGAFCTNDASNGLHFDVIGDRPTWARYGTVKYHSSKNILIANLLANRKLASRQMRWIGNQQRGLSAILEMYGLRTCAESITTSYRMIYVMRNGYFPDLMNKIMEKRVDINGMSWDEILREISRVHGGIESIN